MPLSDIVKLEKLDFVAHMLCFTALFVCRLSGLAFYLRLVGRHPRIQLFIHCATEFIIAGCLALFFLLLLHCRPITGLWPYRFQVSNDGLREKCLPWGTVYGVIAGVSLGCDIAMLGIPATLIVRLHASRKRKIQLFSVLFPGILVIILSFVRIWLAFEGNTDDSSWFYYPTIVVESSELSGILIALSVPALKPLVSNWCTRSHQARRGSSLRSSRTWQGNRLKSAAGNAVYEMDRPIAKALAPVSSNGDPRSMGYDSDQELGHKELNVSHDGKQHFKGISPVGRSLAPDSYLSERTWEIGEENGITRIEPQVL